MVSGCSPKRSNIICYYLFFRNLKAEKMHEFKVNCEEKLMRRCTNSKYVEAELHIEIIIVKNWNFSTNYREGRQLS